LGASLRQKPLLVVTPPPTKLAATCAAPSSKCAPVASVSTGGVPFRLSGSLKETST
jgi:hypothetical protein